MGRNRKSPKRSLADSIGCTGKNLSPDCHIGQPKKDLSARGKVQSNKQSLLGMST